MNEYRIDGKTIKEHLLLLAENGNRDFTASLLPNVGNVLGIRLPDLRRLGRKIARNNWQNYLQSADTFYMEERMLQGIVIGSIPVDDVEEYLAQVAGFVEKINCWAVCDAFDFSGKQQFVDRNKGRVWLFLERWMTSKEEYAVRFGLVMALTHYVDKDYIHELLNRANQIRHEGYYARMAVAWLLSVCFVKFPEETLNLLRNNKLDNFTHNKAIQKITESFRVSEEAKALARSLKRRK